MFLGIGNLSGTRWRRIECAACSTSRSGRGAPGWRGRRNRCALLRRWRQGPPTPFPRCTFNGCWTLFAGTEKLTVDFTDFYRPDFFKHLSSSKYLSVYCMPTRNSSSAIVALSHSSFCPSSEEGKKSRFQGRGRSFRRRFPSPRASLPSVGP